MHPPVGPSTEELAAPAQGGAASRCRGRFLVLEGIDGCGKTTQIASLAEWLPRSGLLLPGAELVVTREPGGTALGQALRQLLLHPPGEAAPRPRPSCCSTPLTGPSTCSNGSPRPWRRATGC
jgi:hypothetical protein